MACRFDSGYRHHVVADYVLFATTFLFEKSSLAHAVAPPLRKKSRSARLLGCKRPRDGLLSLPTFCGNRKLNSIHRKLGNIFFIALRHRQALDFSGGWRFFYGNRRPFSVASADAILPSGAMFPGSWNFRKPYPAWPGGLSELMEVIFRIDGRTSLIPRPKKCPGWPGRSSARSCISNGCKCCYWCQCRCDRAK